MGKVLKFKGVEVEFDKEEKPKEVEVIKTLKESFTDRQLEEIRRELERSEK